MGEPSVGVVCSVAIHSCAFVQIHISCGYLLMRYFGAWEPVQGGPAPSLSSPPGSPSPTGTVNPQGPLGKELVASGRIP